MIPNRRSHRFLRALVLLLAGISFAACCFHGHCGGYHYGGCRYHCAPVRYCR